MATTLTPAPASAPTPIPITIITGFLGSGKTTLILNLIPQLPPSYRLALLKNEFGDVAIDSQLAASASISGVQELLNGCICCNLVGQLGDALATLRTDVSPDRIVVETSGSAFPATLAMEVNRLARESGGAYVLDGVIVVIDVENWSGYEDTSYTAKLQARYTDLVVLNKWEEVGERRVEDCVDRLGDLDVDVPYLRSERGRVDYGVVFGVDGGLARALELDGGQGAGEGGAPSHDHEHEHTGSGPRTGADTAREDGHRSEVDVLSVTLTSHASSVGVEQIVDMARLETFLAAAPKDEIYRIKAILTSSQPPSSSSRPHTVSSTTGTARCILNWAFGRWTFTRLVPPSTSPHEVASSKDGAGQEESATKTVCQMTLILARDAGQKWKRKIEEGDFLVLAASGVSAEAGGDEGGDKGELIVRRVV
ncbi:MAG: hypothetical protein M1838_002722 [Thelocarpon superellum]|nr:MAG: hypothetical protein M1838_002722 [Thelocarpon superellum]